MVKNTGGNKAKKFASKSFNISNRATRFAIEDGEVYAIVQRMLGNNICEILCIDGTTKLCIIRGKFLGKGKRDNKLARGIWILVGMREWEVTTKDKEKCDLLEVYSDTDKEKLIKNSKQSFRAFLSVGEDDGDIDHDDVKFINNREDELYNENLEAECNNDVVSGEEGEEGEEEGEEKKKTDLADQLNWVDINDI